MCRADKIEEAREFNEIRHKCAHAYGRQGSFRSTDHFNEFNKIFLMTL